LWGLAIDGEQGVRQVIEILRHELDLGMALCGYSSIASLKKDGKNLIYRTTFH